MTKYLADEQLSSFMLRIDKEVIGVVLLNYLSNVHKDNSVSNVSGKSHLMGHAYHCDPLHWQAGLLRLRPL